MPLSPPTIVALLVVSSTLFLVFPSPLWRASRTDGHLLRFAFSYFAIVPFAALALRARRRLKLDALVTIVAMVWGAKLVVTTLLYQTVGPSRRAELHAPDPNDRSELTEAQAPTAIDSSLPVGSLTGRIVEPSGPVAGAIVSLCEAAPNQGMAAEGPQTLAVSTDLGTTPPLSDATIGDELALTTIDASPHAVRGILGGVSAFSVAVVRGRASTVQLSTAGTIALEVDDHPFGTLIVFAHALHARTDTEGRFQLSSLPLGGRDLCVLTGDPVVSHVVHAIVGTPGEITFALGTSS